MAARSSDSDEPAPKRHASPLPNSDGPQSPSNAANLPSGLRSPSPVESNSTLVTPANPLGVTTTLLDSNDGTPAAAQLLGPAIPVITFPDPDSAWPPWLLTTYKVLTTNANALGAPWYHLLNAFTHFESCSDTADDVACSTTNRPPQVGLWIQNARKRSPAISDLELFERQWWAWWRALQPSWRAYSTTTGPISTDDLLPVPTDVATSSDSLTVLDCPGKNGLLSVISSLRWWGDEIRALTPQDSGWFNREAAESWKLGITDVNRMVVLVWLEKADTETHRTYLSRLTYDAYGSTIIS